MNGRLISVRFGTGDQELWEHLVSSGVNGESKPSTELKRLALLGLQSQSHMVKCEGTSAIEILHTDLLDIKTKIGDLDSRISGIMSSSSASKAERAEREDGDTAALKKLAKSILSPA